jgi:hypothetical protein
MKAEDIENYLSQLGQELQKRGIQKPIQSFLGSNNNSRQKTTEWHNDSKLENGPNHGTGLPTNLCKFVLERSRGLRWATSGTPGMVMQRMIG